MMKLGIYGGSFDPVHLGHLHAAQQILRTFTLDRLDFLPCNNHALKGGLQASAAQRLAMLEEAIAGQVGFAIDTQEMRRTGTSYTIDSLRQIRSQNPNAAVGFVLGLDAFAQLNRWQDWRALLDTTHLILMQRPGARLPDNHPMADYLAQHQCSDLQGFHQSTHGQIFTLDAPMLDISSRRVREAIRQHKNSVHLLPESVSDYIQQHNLYHE